MSVNPDEAGPFFYVLSEPMRILFVDDDPILREFAVVNLSSEQATVDTAPDGAAALFAISAHPPDIVLLDLEMPTLDGFGVLKALRASQEHRDLPVIVVTGREDVEAVDRAFAAGATSFVVKPMNWRLLSHQLRYVHRTSMAERRMASTLTKLASEGAQFVARALARDPSLRGAAVAFARAADAALKPEDAIRAA
jgi:DNA-binding response OmpR family regulator